MYDDDEDDNEDNDRDRYAREYGTPDEMRRAVREYLLDEEGSGLSEEEADRLLAMDEAGQIINRAVDLRSFAYYAGDKIAELGTSNNLDKES